MSSKLPTSGSRPAKISSVTTDEKEIDREEIFLWDLKPFILNQQLIYAVWLGSAHLFAAYYIYLDCYLGQVPRSVICFDIIYGYIGGLGITVGCHRYWTHKTFKANLPLQIILMIMQSTTAQHTIFKWCLDHRIHHKYTDTDADPHNSKRGFWFSHMGWLLLPRHKDVEKQCRTFDMTDLERDPVVRFQCRWYMPLLVTFNFILPISLIYVIWDMDWLYCVAANYRRYVISLHFTWSVNSVAHLWGDKPYDKTISTVENPVVSLLAVGEGWHNYHHCFPWDYKTSEFGWKINPSTMFIDFFAWIRWAYDLRTVSKKTLEDRLKRTGNEMQLNYHEQKMAPGY